ncbi:murein L,D-transpeptidase catalytic domain family protein [Vulcaniibacterium gelatinicum]|uniref:murein L,D-transpeptidase catalytic domain family protein n=1 Tax=Vulcaniibacterium gelatinicum TaxID=2598725 RepID=UPI0011C9F840|nr:murein L,D-transpeptidase catalytic domain family protein [Vulcaniibacterium gelatinicum]
MSPARLSQLPTLIFLLLAVAAAPAVDGRNRESAPAPMPALSLGNAPLLSRLRLAAPQATPEALALALEARACAIRSGAVGDAERLAVIDYSRPSTEPRMWVFDLRRGQLLYAEHVAHGRGSGENLATAFSNREGSHQSSLGLFATADTYIGGNGYSLRMDGLEPGINDAARARAIVMHGAPYVDPEQARRQGRLGRSLGCPALRPAVAREVIDTLKGGQLLFAYYPDRAWLERSRFLRCRDGDLAAAR